MSCSPSDLKDYFLGELGDAEGRRVREHLGHCGRCREELDRLRLTQAALRSLPDEEPPRRIAFVSDQVFEPRWWQLWHSPRLGFASAAMLSLAILVHAFVRPVPTAAPAGQNAAAIEQRIGAEVARRLEPAITAAVAESEARQAAKTIELVRDAEKRIDFDRRADRVAIEEAFTLLQKKLNRWYTANAALGDR
jgi:anti-sigma factor RsiW